MRKLFTASIAAGVAVFGGLAAIKAGTLDNSSWVKPGIQIWCDSAQPWGVLTDDLKEAAQNP